MGKIYTRSGDKGTTGIHGGTRVSKTDIRIETNGTVDELNVAVGAIRTLLKPDHEWQTLLREIQLNLMTAMSLIATNSDSIDSNPNKLSENLVAEIEERIDKINVECSPSNSFILPGGTAVAIAFHQARVIARKAERRLWELNEFDKVPEIILHYFNRLSDLFFIMARFELQTSGEKEEIWRNFGYKRNQK